MTAITETRLPSPSAAGLALSDLWSPPYRQAILWAFALTFLAYSYQIYTVALNSDEIRNLETASAALAQGRWAFDLLYEQLLGHLPHPGIENAVGLLFQVLACVLVGILAGLDRPVPLFVIALLGATHINLAQEYGYDAIVIVAPAGNLVAAMGLLIAQRRSLIFGAAVLSLAPAFYPVSFQFAAVAILLCGLGDVLRGDDTKSLVKQLAWLAGCLVLGGVLYLATLKVLSALGFLLDERTAFGGFDVLTRIKSFFTVVGDQVLPRDHVIRQPGDHPSYQSPLYKIGSLVLCAVVLLRALPDRRRVIQTAVLILGIFAASAFLLLVSSTDYYPDRALSSYSLAFGGLGAFAISDLGRFRSASISRNFDRRLVGIAAAAVTLVYLVHAFSISQLAFDEHMAYESELLAANRTVARIEGLDGFPSGNAPIPIAVFGDAGWASPIPFGEIGSVRVNGWSRETIYRILDKRFQKATPAQRAAVRPAIAGRPVWPAKESVFLQDGIVVVVMSHRADDAD